MLPEVGMSELVVIAIVALIVVGPKDLPVLLRRFGQFMAKLRGMASEFRSSFDEMARQTELDELRKEVDAMRRGQFADIAEQDQLMRASVGEIEHSMSEVGVQLHSPMSYQYDTPDAPPLEISEKERWASQVVAYKIRGLVASTVKSMAPEFSSRYKTWRQVSPPSVVL